MTRQSNLLEKYYNGETTIEEEKELKQLLHENGEHSLENDVFGYFEEEAAIPEGLEDDLFAGVQHAVSQKKTIRMRLYSIASVAALVVFVLGFFFNARNQKQTQMADSFFVMEQALFQVSESLQPDEEQEEMLILWVDDEVEIIIN